MTILTFRKFCRFVSGNGDLRSPVQPMETKGRLAQSYHPDIILSDVMMPGTSGIALLKSLQAEDSTSRDSDDRLLNRVYGGSGDQGRREGCPDETIGLSQTEVDPRSNPEGFEVTQETERTLIVTSAQGLQTAIGSMKTLMPSFRL